jgi:hypothetical protein
MRAFRCRGGRPDFFCIDHRLIVEIDGRQHGREADCDAKRTAEIERFGLTVIRFGNAEIINDRNAVLAAIRKAAGGSRGPQAARADPCNSHFASSAIPAVAVAGGRPTTLRDAKPVGEPGSSPADPSTPNSRLGRSSRSPLAQGWDRMDATVIVGIDVSKDRLDVHVRPGGEAFFVKRDGDGIAALVERLRPLDPATLAVEATGGFETVVAAGLAGAGLPVVVVNPAQVRAFANALGKRARTDPIDAAVIAHFVEATKPAVRPLPDEATQLLADPRAIPRPSSSRSAFETRSS